MAKRNVRKLNLRPPLPRRAIVWFPPIEDKDALRRIQQFRLRHDPQAEKCPPHVSLVFPFHANLTVAQIASHIKHVTAGWPVLPVTFHGVESVQARFILLMCELRRDAISQLHDKLYSGVLKNFLRDDIVYQPHITLGRADGAAAFQTTLGEAELLFRETYRATLRELSILTHHDDGRISVDEVVQMNLG
jgi:2'-5' RNA ligase